MEEYNIILKEEPEQSIKSFRPFGFWYHITDEQDKIYIQLNKKIDPCNYNIDSECFINFKLVDFNNLKLENADKILCIDNEEDLTEFNTKYTTGNVLHTGILWDKVAQSFGGIEIRQEFSEMREKLLWFQTFDVKCGCIWNTKIPNYMKLASESYI